jgi:hypothetical protein
MSGGPAPNPAELGTDIGRARISEWHTFQIVAKEGLNETSHSPLSAEIAIFLLRGLRRDQIWERSVVLFLCFELYAERKDTS